MNENDLTEKFWKVINTYVDFMIDKSLEHDSKNLVKQTLKDMLKSLDKEWAKRRKPFIPREYKKPKSLIKKIADVIVVVFILCCGAIIGSFLYWLFFEMGSWS